MPKDVLFIHQNFPGQFRHLAAHLARQDAYRVLALGQQQAPGISGVRLIRYRTRREPDAGVHRYVRPMEQAVLAGQAVAEVLLRLQRQGFAPELVFAHPGWGESLFVKDIFPGCRLVHYCEWYYRADGADVGFDPEHPVTPDDRARIRAKNAHQLLALDVCDIGIAPTHWQKAQFPPAYHAKIDVIHEGIDTAQARPDPLARFVLPDGRELSSADPVITYAARNLEPYRGFPQFLRALSLLQQQHPSVEALIIGGDGVSYGRAAPHGRSWREHLLRDVELDPARTHFLGRQPYAAYLSALQITRAHAYLSYPFVLSWSLLEALACGAPLLASDTPPLREVIRPGDDGQLLDFFDPHAWRQALLTRLADPPTPAQRAQQSARLAARYRHQHASASWLHAASAGQTMN